MTLELMILKTKKSHSSTYCKFIETEKFGAGRGLKDCPYFRDKEASAEKHDLLIKGRARIRV